MFIENGASLSPANNNVIATSQDGTNWESIRKAAIVKVNGIFIANVDTVRANRQDRKYSCQVFIDLIDGNRVSFDTQDISNQITWFNPAWTAPAQYQAGMNQAVTDINGWL